MKQFRLLIVITVFSSCNFFYNHIEFNGKATGLSGNVIIKNGSGNTVFGATIKNGVFHIRQQTLNNKDIGFYSLFIPGEADPFEIYLEPGVYDIETRQRGLVHYPIIKSTSKIQNELSAYYTLADTLKHTTHNRVTKLFDQLNSPAAKMLPRDKYMELVAEVNEAQTQDYLIGSKVMEVFLKQMPQNEVIAHIMANTDYSNNPVRNYELYEQFSAAAKQSDDGIEIGERLKHLIKLVPGQTAPELAGATPDGKKIDLKSLNKKAILVEFWKSTIVISRKNHKEMIEGLLPNLADKGFGIVSVSLDTKRDWWVSAVKDDKLTWPQVNDLKGFESANVADWGISDIPVYDIVDGQGRMVARDVAFDNIMFTVTNYLDNH